MDYDTVTAHDAIGKVRCWKDKHHCFKLCASNGFDVMVTIRAEAVNISRLYMTTVPFMASV